MPGPSISIASYDAQMNSPENAIQLQSKQKKKTMAIKKWRTYEGASTAHTTLVRCSSRLAGSLGEAPEEESAMMSSAANPPLQIP